MTYDPATAPTPPWAVRALLLQLSYISAPGRGTTQNGEALRVLDPCAGAGTALAVIGADLPRADVRSVELSPDLARLAARVARRTANHATECADFLQLAHDWTGEWWPDLIIAHPPPKRALVFAKRCAELVVPTRGVAALLLPSRFFGAGPNGMRGRFLRLRPPQVWALPRRLPDSPCDHAWFAWHGHRDHLHGAAVIDLTDDDAAREET